jgi:hypothetical protein
VQLKAHSVEQLELQDIPEALKHPTGAANVYEEDFSLGVFRKMYK